MNLLTSFRLEMLLVVILMLMHQPSVMSGDAQILSSLNQDDNPVRMEIRKHGNLYSLYAFSDVWSEGSVKVSVTGSNIHTAAVDAEWRHLSKNLDDPVCEFEKVVSQVPISFQPKLECHIGSVKGNPNLQYIYRLPYPDNIRHSVVQGFKIGTHTDPYNHYAVDFSLNSGDTVCAARAGTVVGIRSNSEIGGPDQKYVMKSNYVVVDHEDGTYAEYFHLLANGVKVKLGEHVSAGQLIGLSGNSGFSMGPHLHFCVFTYDQNHRRQTIPVSFATKSGIAAPNTSEVLENLDTQDTCHVYPMSYLTK